MTREEERDQIVDELRRQLGGPGLRRFELRIFEQGIRWDDDWWYVPISPRKGDVRAFDYAPKLRRVEENLKRRPGAKVLLIPAQGASE